MRVKVLKWISINAFLILALYALLNSMAEWYIYVVYRKSEYLPISIFDIFIGAFWFNMWLYARKSEKK